jgi:precorrin-6B methylase 2
MADAEVTDREEALVERLFLATLGALELFGVYLGERLGLYAALADGEPRSVADLAADAGIAPRYAQEWLEQQAVAGIVDVAGDGDATTRTYRLPPEHVAVLADPESLSYVAAFAPLLVGIGGALPEVVDAYRTGNGVAFARYGEALRDGQAAINRPAFTHQLAGWVATMPDVRARLEADPPARIGDFGCGTGWSTIALARAFPKADVEGIDLDEASVADAERNAAAQGMAGDVRFVLADAAGAHGNGPYELACMFEALHDTPRPVEVLEAMRAALADGGSILLADERVASEFTAPGRRDRADDVRLEHLALPAGGHGRPARRADGHGPAGADGAGARRPGRPRHGRGAADRERLLPLLPPAGVSARRKAACARPPGAADCPAMRFLRTIVVVT